MYCYIFTMKFWIWIEDSWPICFKKEECPKKNEREKKKQTRDKDKEIFVLRFFVFPFFFLRHTFLFFTLIKQGGGKQQQQQQYNKEKKKEAFLHFLDKTIAQGEIYCFAFFSLFVFLSYLPLYC